MGRGWYAVANGRSTGVYTSWSDCETQTKGYRNAVFKKFSSPQAAHAYVASGGGGGGRASGGGGGRFSGGGGTGGGAGGYGTSGGGGDDDADDDGYVGAGAGGAYATPPAVAAPAKKRSSSGPHRASAATPPSSRTAKRAAAASARAKPSRSHVTLHFDGGARGNPGPAGAGALLRDAGTDAVVWEGSEFLGDGTNNQAEYRALILGLRSAKSCGADRVSIRGDSKLVVEQVTGRWRVKEPKLKGLHSEAVSLLKGFDKWDAAHVPRAENNAADRLANDAMDAGRSSSGGTSGGAKRTKRK